MSQTLPRLKTHGIPRILNQLWSAPVQSRDLQSHDRPEVRGRQRSPGWKLWHSRLQKECAEIEFDAGANTLQSASCGVLMPPFVCEGMPYAAARVTAPANRERVAIVVPFGHQLSIGRACALPSYILWAGSNRGHVCWGLLLC